MGVANSAPYAQVDKAVKAASKAGRKVHYIAPSRYFNKLRLMEMIGRARIDLGVSEPLTKAIISMRLVKEPVEIAAIDAACDLGFKMHSVARDSIRLGIVEQDIAGASPSPPSSPSTAKPCTTICTTRSSNPAG